jgi:hypothetical protein
VPATVAPEHSGPADPHTVAWGPGGKFAFHALPPPPAVPSSADPEHPGPADAFPHRVVLRDKRPPGLPQASGGKAPGRQALARRDTPVAGCRRVVAAIFVSSPSPRRGVSGTQVAACHPQGASGHLPHRENPTPSVIHPPPASHCRPLANMQTIFLTERPPPTQEPRPDSAANVPWCFRSRTENRDASTSAFP